MVELERKYQQFLDEIGWDEFEPIEKSYFFEELSPEPGEPGAVLHILQSKKKPDYIVIKHINTGAQLEIRKNKLGDFRDWMETNFAGGEDGAAYFDWVDTMNKEDMREATYIQVPPKEEKPESVIKNNIPNDERKAVLDINKLTSAICDWMNYQQTISRSINLLHEASFRYPIAEFLERKVSTAATLEKQHPLFKKPMDFQWTIDGKKYFLECKYAKKNYTNGKQEMQRYFNDICRLYYCMSDSQNEECYLLVCGKDEAFKQCFFKDEVPEEEEDSTINKKRYNLFLTFDEIDPKKISLERIQQEVKKSEMDEKTQEELNNLYYDFCDEYKKDEKGGDKLLDKIELTIQLAKHMLREAQHVYMWKIVRGKLGEFEGKTFN